MADEENQSESVNALREKLSSTSNTATDALARAVIAEESLTYVKVEDFKGLEPSGVEARARELNAEREAAANQALSELLESKGVEDLDALIAGQGGGKSDRQSAIEAARRQTGQPVGSAKGDISHLDPLDGSGQMVHHFQEKAKRS